MIVVTPGFFGIQAYTDGVKIAIPAGVAPRRVVPRHWLRV
jgi:hypothetical protein